MAPVKIRRISKTFKARIETLSNQGLTPLAIRKRIESEEDVSITTRAIKLYLQRRRIELETGILTGVAKRPEKRRLQQQHLEYIDQAIENDDEVTAPELQTRLQEEFGLQVSLSTIKRERANLGWTRAYAKYCQIIRDVNKEKRYRYCCHALVNNEQFDDVIFTDESTVKLQCNVKMSFRRRGSIRRLKGVPKHPYQVHVWAGISRRGATKIAIFTGRLVSSGYEDILGRYLPPFVEQAFPDGHRLYQDNDPKHVSRSTKEWLAENNITAMEAPPESPDLNPIELIWASLKYHLRRKVKPRNKDQLVAGIIEYWESCPCSD